jgi:uncharacterized damage-inducible protein DinB
MYRYALGVSLLTLAAAYAADPAAPSISKIYDQQLKMVEGEVVSLVEAMPEAKFGFAPSGGEFQGVRTFAQQASHIAYVNYSVAAAVLGEKNPSESGKNENGPERLKGKNDIVKYLKESFAYTHRAMAALTDANQTAMVQSAFGNNKVPRVYMANVALWHSMDHYGQMVVYARMNGIVPPASRQ